MLPVNNLGADEFCGTLIREEPDESAADAPEAALTNFTTFVVYTVSSLVELTTPAVHLLVDTEPPVSNISFDQDLDAEDLGGTLP